MSSRRKTIVRIGAFAVLALLLSACIKLDMNLTVNSDNTVSGTIIFALNKQLIELSGQSADDLLGSAAPVPSGVQGIETEPTRTTSSRARGSRSTALPSRSSTRRAATPISSGSPARETRTRSLGRSTSPLPEGAEPPV